jgi:SAM-dependent methyltransferase
VNAGEHTGDDLQRWNAVADAYAEATGPAGDSFYRRLRPFLEAELPDLDGARVLDLGCGHGWLAGEYAARGAAVVGVDGSAALLERARAEHPAARFVEADLVQGLPADLLDPPFDAVVAHMVVMDVPDLTDLFADVARALTRDGVFVASLLHPAYFSHAVDGPEAPRPWRRHVGGYLDHEERWIAAFGGHRHYHRPLSWYVGQLAAAGFVVTGLTEPPSLPQHGRPEAEWTEHERWFSRIPTMLAWSARLRSPGA